MLALISHTHDAIINDLWDICTLFYTSIIIFGGFAIYFVHFKKLYFFFRCFVSILYTSRESNGFRFVVNYILHECISIYKMYTQVQCNNNVDYYGKCNFVWTKMNVSDFLQKIYINSSNTWTTIYRANWINFYFSAYKQKQSEKITGKTINRNNRRRRRKKTQQLNNIHKCIKRKLV